MKLKKIIIEVPEKYSNIMALTLIGGVGTDTINATTSTHNLAEGTHFIVPEIGAWIQKKGEDESK